MYDTICMLMKKVYLLYQSRAFSSVLFPTAAAHSLFYTMMLFYLRPKTVFFAMEYVISFYVLIRSCQSVLTCSHDDSENFAPTKDAALGAGILSHGYLALGSFDT